MPGLQRLEYTVTQEPLENSHPDNDAFTKYLGSDRNLRLHGLITTNPALAVAEFEALLVEYGQAPLLYNWLAAAYTQIGRDDQANQIIRLNYEHYPDYLFARVNYADLLVSEGKVGEAAKVMDDKFDLKLLYPNRDLFHITEYTAMSALAIKYYLRAGQRELAQKLWRTLKKLAPDSGVTYECARLIAAARFQQTFTSLMDRAREQYRRGQPQGEVRE